jgi:hypothetical protein
MHSCSLLQVGQPQGRYNVKQRSQRREDDGKSECRFVMKRIRD